MSLPNLSLPTFELIVPSTQKKITVRPYTVKEQTIILQAVNSDSVEDSIHCIKQLLESCIVSPSPQYFNINMLTMFDLQYIFLRIRARSVEEIITLNYRCKNIINEKECDLVSTYTINVNDISVHFPEKSKNLIELSNGIGIKLNYPNIISAQILEKYGEINTPEALYEAVANDIEYVYDSEKIYDEFTKNELQLFLSQFSINDATKIYEFYANQPTIQHTIKFKCKCGYEEDIIISGITNFLE